MVSKEIVDPFMSSKTPSNLPEFKGTTSTTDPILFFKKASVDEKFLFKVCDKTRAPSIFKKVNHR